MLPANAWSWVGTVEFYVVCTVVAAAVVALCVRPSRRGQAITRTVAGFLCEGNPDASPEPELWIECLEDGNVLIRRTCVHDTGHTGALSLAIKHIGFDLEIQERLTPGSQVGDVPVTEAVFILKFLAPEWYHVRYTCDPTDRFAAFSLHVRPGLKMRVDLRQ